MSNEVFEKLTIALEQLGWDETDEIKVDIGGAASTGTASHPDANPKWAKPFGTVTYHNDAFIVIKNVTRNPVISSPINTEHKQQHPYKGVN